MRARNILTIAAVFLAGCAAVQPAAMSGLPAIETYPPGQIIVSTSGSGSLRSQAGCLMFVQPAGALAAQFPQGTSYQGGSVRLPDGELIPLGTRISLVFEARPGAISRHAGCAGRPAIQVIRRKT